jgi:methionine-rich copper-binding protein CopC
MKQFHKRVGGWLSCAVALLLIALPWQRALAHADAATSEPAPGALVTTPLETVQITFTQDLFRREGMNRIEVYDASGGRVDLDDPIVDDDDRRLLTVSLQPELAQGEYTVRWYSLSAEDGHEGEGEFSFTVAGTTSTTDAESEASLTESAAVTETEELTSSDEANATAAPTATPMEPATAAAEEESPAAAPSNTVFGLNCLGSAPLGLAVGLAWMGRRRRFG